MTDRSDRKETKVSVIVPVYDTEKWLPDCMDSVLSQTLDDIELIVVDDCSPGGCEKIVRGYTAADGRVRYIRNEKNMGQGFSRNAGIDAASGEYIYLLDSDDMVKPEALAELSRLADAEGLDGVFFDSEVIFESDELERKHSSYPAARKGSYPTGPVAGRELFELFKEQDEWTCYIQRQFWRRDFLDREGIRFPVRHEHEDEVFAFEAILAAERVMYVPERYFVRRYREGSVMTKAPGPENFHGYMMCMKEMLKILRERGISSKGTDRDISRIYEKLTRYYAMLSDRHDLASLFTEEDMPMYMFFEASQKSYLYYSGLSESVLEKAKNACGVFIYGAGVVGKKVFEALSLAGVAVDGFIVTEKKDAGRVVKARPVTALSETDIPDGALVIIAAGEGYRAEIEAGLEEAGADHCYYR